MKSIDFLPDWYKEARRRRAHLRRQYIAICTLFLVMVSYNLVATYSISTVSEQIARIEPKRIESERTIHELAGSRAKLSELEKKARALDQMDSKIDVASTLAELSTLVDENIILRKLEFSSEPFSNAGEPKAKSRTVVRSAGSSNASAARDVLGDVRFRVLLGGVAADPGHVAALIVKLEESPYFRKVYPSFSRNVVLQIADRPSSGVSGKASNRAGTVTPKAASFRATEFEITCTLANHEEAAG